MIRTSAFVTAAVIGVVVFTGTTPAQAADQSAIKRAIVVTVLNNLGVQPTDQLVSEIVTDIPIELLDSALVLEVGTALDNSEDPTLIIGGAVDSNGDGVPDADATVDATDDSVDESDDNSSGSSGSSGNNSGSTNTDDESDNSSGDGNTQSGDDGDNDVESGDDEDN